MNINKQRIQLQRKRRINQYYLYVNNIKKLVTKYELSRRLNQIIKQDEGKLIQRVKCSIIGRKKNYFILSKHANLLQVKQKQKKNNINPYFISIRALKTNYEYSFYNDFKAIKPRKKVNYVIEQNNGNHLHFMVNISKNELDKSLKYLFSQEKYKYVLSLNNDFTQFQTNFYLKKKKPLPVLIKYCVDVPNLINNYFKKELITIL